MKTKRTKEQKAARPAKRKPTVKDLELPKRGGRSKIGAEGVKGGAIYMKVDG